MNANLLYMVFSRPLRKRSAITTRTDRWAFAPASCARSPRRIYPAVERAGRSSCPSSTHSNLAASHSSLACPPPDPWPWLGLPCRRLEEIPAPSSHSTRHHSPYRPFQASPSAAAEGGHWAAPLL